MRANIAVTATVHFHGDLVPLLPRGDAKGVRMHDCARRASIKDVVESFGVPHTEVYGIAADGREVGFGHIPFPGECIDVQPGVPPVDPSTATLLRPDPLSGLRFVVDVNVARLAGHLRLLGFDTEYIPGATDESIARCFHREGRIVLSRDRNLLKRRAIAYGRLIRSQKPLEQLGEVVSFFGLGASSRPFSRCCRCNGTLTHVDKKDILDRLEPLTKRYFDEFRICGVCRQIYWKGSHFAELERIVADAGADRGSFGGAGTANETLRGARDE